MIPRPTTAQLLQQCRRELIENVMPHVGDETILVALEQVQMVLDVCAHRSETELADLVTETAEMMSFVEASLSTHSVGMARTRGAVAAYEAGRSDSLLRSDVGATYDLAAEAFSCAIEELMDVGDEASVDEAVSWMAGPRHQRELATMSNWGMPGRG